MSYITNAADAAGADLPLAGGTMTGAISLANVAGTLTGGGSTATWTPTALTYTYTVAQASGGTGGVIWNFTNSHASGVFLDVNDNTGVTPRGIWDLSVLAAGQPRMRFYRGGTIEGLIDIGTSFGFEIGLATSSSPNAMRVYGGSATGSTIAGGALQLVGGGSTSGTGGSVSITAGAAGTGNSAGGAITQTTTAGAGSAAGGAWTVTCGAGGATGVGGSITITSGIGGSTSGNCGDVALVGANAGTGSGNGGGINLTSGNGSATGTGSRGGAIAILTGNGDGSIARQSGVLTITTGTPSATGTSGSIGITTGVGGSASGASGDITLTTGATTSGTSGGITLIVGTPTAGTTGDFSVSGARNFTLTGGGTPVMTLINDDAGATGGPDTVLYRNSASAAANDVMGRILFDGNSATPTRRTMGIIQSVLVTATNGAEDARMEWFNILAGASNQAMILSAGGLLSLDLDGGIGSAAYPVLFHDFNDIELLDQGYTRDAERRNKALERYRELGLVSKKTGGDRPGHMLHVQPWLSLLTGGILQTAERTANTEEQILGTEEQILGLRSENELLRARLTALEARP